MNIYAINGSPRKRWNTHILLEKALEGAASKGGATELVHLYDLSFKGCIGCLECKRKESASLGKCALKDDLSPVLEKIAECDALILGSPIYFGEVTGVMRCFLERLLFQYLSYDKDRTPRTPRTIQTAFIYTMNVPQAMLEQVGYSAKFASYESLLTRILGPARTLISTETLPTDDFDKYHMSMFDADARKVRRETVFPADCQKAFDLGADIVSQNK